MTVETPEPRTGGETLPERPVFIVGPPGSGKSTLLQSLASLTAPALPPTRPGARWRTMTGWPARALSFGPLELVEFTVWGPELEMTLGRCPVSPAALMFVLPAQLETNGADREASAVLEQLVGLAARYLTSRLIVLISRVDDAESAAISRLRSRIEGLLPSSDVIEVSSTEGFGLDLVLRKLAEVVGIQGTLKPAEDSAAPAGPDPSAATEAARRALALSVSEFFLRRERVPRLVLLGPSSAGKSRLFNVLVGRDLARVSARANTTTQALIGDMQGLKIVDTPPVDTLGGLGDGSEPEILAGVDLAVYLVNATGRMSDRDQEILEWLSGRRPTVLVVNKIDTLPADDRRLCLEALEAALIGHRLTPLPVSAKSGEGLDRLMDAIRIRIDELTEVPATPPPATGAPRAPAGTWTTARTGARAPEAGPPSPSPAGEAAGWFRAESAWIVAHSVLAAVCVYFLDAFQIRLPFIKLVVVGGSQYLLLERLSRRIFPEEILRRVLVFAGTAIGCVGFLILGGKLPWVVGRILDTLLAFATTMVVGFGGLAIGRVVDRYLPPWARKLVLR